MYAYNQWPTRSEMFRFHSHNTYICTIYVVLVKEAKLLASIQPMGNKKRNVSLPFPQHIYTVCTIYVVLVKEAKLLASIQAMGKKKRNISLPSHNTYICTIYVVLVKEAKLLASIQPMGNKKRNISLPSHNTYICTIIRCVSKRSETSRFHTDNGQHTTCTYHCCVDVKEAKHLASKDQ